MITNSIIYHNSFQKIGNNSEEAVFTPFGATSKSKVHYINNSQALFIDGDSVKVVDSRKNEVIQNYVLSTRKKSLESNYNLNIKADGWITYAYCIMLNPIIFSTNYKVPAQPKESNSQLIYIFTGLGGGGTWSRILQPVLQWGVSPAGGGDYWAICNWYVFGNGEFFHDSLIKVNQGDELKAVIMQTSFDNKRYSYTSYFDGYSSGLHILNEDELNTAYIVFETYNVKRKEEYPTDEKIRFNNIKLNSGIDEHYGTWTSFDDWNNPKNDLGQKTKIVFNNRESGIIEIHFHSPLSIDGFEEIHLYPNPVKDKLHISPGWIKNDLSIFPDKPISHCNIELFDLKGNLLYQKYIELFDFEFYLDMSYYKQGFYILRFSYDNRSHSFKIIKE